MGARRWWSSGRNRRSLPLCTPALLVVGRTRTARASAATAAPRLEGDAGREVRKTVTVLFADVTGSTALGERLDPESFRRVMARYFETARACLERHGGTVEKFIGDAVMAAFGVPVVHEDDALARCAPPSSSATRSKALNGELERSYGVTLQLRTGVNTGEVVTGTRERLVTGDAVNVAARLEQAAEPGEILIGERPHRLARGAIEDGEDSAALAQGKVGAAGRLPPARDRGRSASSSSVISTRRSSDGAASSPACGRRSTTRCPLGAAGCSRSSGRRGSASRASPARYPPSIDEEASVLTGRCLPYGEGITYWPMIEIFREAGAEEELETALSAGAPDEIFWSVRKALKQRARERPLALVVEDIHWAEPTLLDLAEHLGNWTRDAPVLLLCLARPELLDERPAWAESR